MIEKKCHQCYRNPADPGFGGMCGSCYTYKKRREQSDFLFGLILFTFLAPIWLAIAGVILGGFR